MSTVDPSIAKAQREARRTAKRPSTARVLILLVLLLAGGFGLGSGWGGFGMLDEFGEPPLTSVLGTILGLMLTIAAGALWAVTATKRSDIGFGYGAAATLIGAGAGLLVVAAPHGYPAVAVAIAVGLLIVGVLFLLLGIVAAASRNRQRSRDAETVRSGTLTTATVSDKGYDFFHESPRILTTVTFTFHDLQGTQRWVQKTMLIEQARPVVEGQETRLWYDASHPGDARGIVVELAWDHAFRR
ncbi:DUF3592 domain-containing protein [Leifsonia aquatica]|uniref:DUF3592 domain-containing protein n=1 Tax=Leifsonia aquatica TaxID=144185 RepID=UPI00046AA8CC|nr:DUF3592 domain-containing protein [Leifsonia aquatica]